MQSDELIVTEPEQARALQETGFLSRYLEPASPSDVARDLGMPANLAHHHAKRHAALGILGEVKREGGKVYYQLTARTFKHDRHLLPAGDPDEHTSVMLALLEERFLSAYSYCDSLENGADPSWHVYAFDRDALPGAPAESGGNGALAPRPAHFQARTLRLSPHRYRDLVRRISALIAKAEADDAGQGGAATFAFLAMDGVLQDGSRDTHYLSTFVPPVEPDEDPQSWEL
ncbi:MAG TPA: hypothetical protein VF168_04060 [Trueperaceae bacterium]